MKFQITSERLLLKVLTPEFAPMVLDFYCRNSDVFEQYEPIVGENFYSLEHQKTLLSFEYKSALKLNTIRYFIFEKNNPNRVIGTVSFRNIVKPIYSSCTVGYKMDQEYWRQGYCKEALELTIPMIQEELGIHRIEALVLPDNTASINLLKTLGFEEEGLLRDKILLNNKWRDHLIYSLISSS